MRRYEREHRLGKLGRLESLRANLRAVPVRVIDVLGASFLLVLLAPLILLVALWIKLDSRGPAFYGARRVGYRGREFKMLKFRKMHDGALGSPLTTEHDERFTAVGRLLAHSKLDEVPQLWNVLVGQMSLVGPRPEDPQFVAAAADDYQTILSVRPGVTGLSQLAFAREATIPVSGDRVNHYLERLFPQKTAMDVLYVRNQSLFMNLRILWWTVVSVGFQVDVAVHRETARIGRRMPRELPVSAAAPGLVLTEDQ
jgi:lipopolysaccharide/colanic/teichoic acid biosynthesis glycosyltransferase